MRVLREVVYMTKSNGPRTEPWGHRRRMCTRRIGHVGYFFDRLPRLYYGRTMVVPSYDRGSSTRVEPCFMINKLWLDYHG